MKIGFGLFLFMVFLCLRAYAEVEDSFRVNSHEPHQIILLNNGLASLESRLQMIDQAERSIDVEYFIYNLDKSGQIFTQALIKKAKTGVKVRMLLDYFMIKNQFSPFFAYEMEKFGVEVKYFNVTSTLNIFSGQYRNHRKVLIVDGKEAITGGRNIGDEYFDLREDFNFLDRDLKISGPVVKNIQETFNQVWNSKLTKKVERSRKPTISDATYNQSGGHQSDFFRFEHDLNQWKQSVVKAFSFLTHKDELFEDNLRDKGKQALEQEFHGSCDEMSYFSEHPIIGKKNRSLRIIKHNISDRIRNAKESVLFDSPYFIADDESKDALDEALSNNVKVTLLTNSLNSTDAIYVYAAFDSIVKGWIEKGLETYIFKGDLPNQYSTIDDKISHARFGVHAKSFVFDNKDVIIGTFNFDPRSANLNTEMTVSCENNPELAKFVSDNIQLRIDASFHLDSAKAVDELEFYNVGFFKRLKYYLFKIPSNALDYLL